MQIKTQKEDQQDNHVYIDQNHLLTELKSIVADKTITITEIAPNKVLDFKVGSIMKFFLRRRKF